MSHHTKSCCCGEMGLNTRLQDAVLIAESDLLSAARRQPLDDCEIEQCVANLRKADSSMSNGFDGSAFLGQALNALDIPVERWGR